jgi:hypothetical protein
MLAGRMKLSNFLAIVGVGGVVAALLGVLWWSKRPAEPEAPATRAVPYAGTKAPAPNPPPWPALPPKSGAAAAGAPTPGGRPVDADVMMWLGKALGQDKRKDVTKGKPYKVNVYQGPDSKIANRAKVDLDRDDKWDEKFTLKDGTITRQVASNDDEQYDRDFVWRDGAWATP